MKSFVIFLLAFTAISIQALAQEDEGHLLDGTSVNYTYEDGGAVESEFLDGRYNYKWVKGPNRGTSGSERYQSRKLGPKMYMVSFMVETNKSFVTIVFHFKKNVISTSASIAPGTDQEVVLFDAGVIDYFNLKENQSIEPH